MCSHYLVDPVACTPAAGWEKGQIENQVGLTRERFFTPRIRVRSYEELNGWLLDQCIAHAKSHPHPEARNQTIWDMFEAERPSLVPYTGRFDGYHAVPALVSKALDVYIWLAWRCHELKGPGRHLVARLERAVQHDWATAEAL